MVSHQSIELIQSKMYDLIIDTSEEQIHNLSQAVTDYVISKMTSSYEVPRLVKKALIPATLLYAPTVGVVAKHANNVAEKILLLDPAKMRVFSDNFPTWQKWTLIAKPFLSVSSSLYQLGCSTEGFLREQTYAAVTFLASKIVGVENFSEDELNGLNAEWNRLCTSGSKLYNSLYEPLTKAVASGLKPLIEPQIKKQIAFLAGTIPFFYSKMDQLNANYLSPEIMGQLLFHSVTDTLDRYIHVHKELKTQEYTNASPVKKTILFLQSISASHNIPGLTAAEIALLTEENYEAEMEKAGKTLVETEILTKLLPLITPPQFESINHILGVVFHKNDSQGIINHVLGEFIAKKLSVLTSSSERQAMIQNLMKSEELPMQFTSKEDLHNAYLRIFLPKVICPLKKKEASSFFLSNKIQNFGKKEALNLQQHPIFSISHLFLLKNISHELTIIQQEIDQEILHMQGATPSASTRSGCRPISPADIKKMTDNLSFIYLEEKRFKKILRPLIAQVVKLKPVQKAFKVQIPQFTFFVEKSVIKLKKDKLVKKLAQLEGLDPLHYPALLIFLDQHLLQHQQVVLNHTEETASLRYLDRLLNVNEPEALRKMLAFNQKIIEMKTRKVVKREERDMRTAFVNSLKSFHLTRQNLENHKATKDQLAHLIKQRTLRAENLLEAREAIEQIEEEIKHDKEMLGQLSSWRT